MSSKRKSGNVVQDEGKPSEENAPNVPSAPTLSDEWKAPSQSGACASNTGDNKHDMGLQKHTSLCVADSVSRVIQTDQPQPLSSPALTDTLDQSSTQNTDLDEDKVLLRQKTMPGLSHPDGNMKRVPAVEKSEKLCGWLNKLGTRAIVKTFKTRWFVYGDSTCKLYYYRTPQDLLHLGEINIHNASFSFDVTDAEKPGLFEISSDGRSFILDARNRQTMMYWLQELQKKRREYSDKRTSLSKSRVSLHSTNQKSVDEGLLARQRSRSNAASTEVNLDNNWSVTAHATSPEFLIGETSASMMPSNSSVTNFSLTNFGTEIRNYVAGLRSPNKDFYAVYDKSHDEEWSIINPSESCTLTSAKASPVTPPNTTPGGATRPTGFDKKFSFSNLKKMLKKGNVEEMDISPPWGSSLEACQQCSKLKTYLCSVKEELASVEEELLANREVTKLLQKEIDKLQHQVRSREEISSLNGECTEALLKQRDDKIVDLEYLLTKTREEMEMIRQQNRVQGDTIGTLQDQVNMYQEMLTAKDDVIMSLTNQVFDLEAGRRSNSNQSSLPTSPPMLRVFTDATEVERLKDSCQAYQMQNKFLTKEILELTQLRENDERRENLLQMQYANLEATFYQTRSKYLFLLNELKTPVRGGEEGRSQDVINQLLSDALDSEDDTIKPESFLSSQNSTIEYDRYGFLRQHDADEDVLVTRATELQRRSRELEIQIKEVDESGAVSHQVKWENFMVSLGDKPLQRSPELKALIRGGIPHQYREPIWKGCINLHIQSKPSNHYQNLVKSSEKNKHNPAAKQVELDLLRTLPTNKYYESMDSEGVAKLRRVLLAYSWHNPDIGYCQGLNRLAAIALLFLSEEDAFWCLVSIVEVIMPQEYYTRTLMAAQADQRVLKDLLQDKLPRLHVHLEQHDIDLSLFTFNWFLTVFVDNIPPEVFLRVWDVLLYEGSKVLFRFALAIFKYKEEELLALNTSININKYLRVIGGKVTDVRRLAEIAFQELNPFPRRVVTARRHLHMIQVKAQLRELDALRQDFRSHNIPADRVEYYSDDEVEGEEESRQVPPAPVMVA